MHHCDRHSQHPDVAVKPHVSRVFSCSLANFFLRLGLNLAKPDFSVGCGLAKLRLASRLKFAAYNVAGLHRYMEHRY